MGLFFRKTVKVAGMNLNLSKKGISASAGPKGLKVNTRGRVSASKSGVRWTKKLF